MRLSEVRNDQSEEASFRHALIDGVSSAQLRATVDALNYPRQYVVQSAANKRACRWICDQLKVLDYDVRLQGEYDNIIAVPRGVDWSAKLTLLGAHYDTVETTPGADDNNSAIAVCLEAARLLAQTCQPITVAIFNREEDGLLGSREFVRNGISSMGLSIGEAHILEMVGYFNSAPGSQQAPAGLPIRLPERGDFLGLLSNQQSNAIVTRLEETSRAINLSTPLVTLKTYLGIEKLVADLLRSDHASFWQAKIPAIMWTDTSNFRNPHYHAPTDLPDTLDYEAMADVTRLIVGDVLRADRD